MGFENKYPYTDFHELNLDWILEQMKSLAAAWDAYQKELTGTNGEWPTFKNYIETSWATYQNNLTGPTGEWPTFKAAMELAWQQYQDSLTGVGGEWPTFKATMEGEWQQFFDTYLQTLGVVQIKGSSITDVMSQKATTDELNKGLAYSENAFQSTYDMQSELAWEAGAMDAQGDIAYYNTTYYHTPIMDCKIDDVYNLISYMWSYNSFIALYHNDVYTGYYVPRSKKWYTPAGVETTAFAYEKIRILAYQPDNPNFKNLRVIDKKIDTVVNYPIVLTANHYVSKSTGSYVSMAGSYSASNIIRITSNNLIIRTHTFGDDGGYAFYDKDGVYISGGDNTQDNNSYTSEISIPANAVYFRFSCFTPDGSEYLRGILSGDIVSGELDKIDTISKDVEQIKIDIPKAEDSLVLPLTWTNGAWSMSTGEFVPTATSYNSTQWLSRYMENMLHGFNYGSGYSYMALKYQGEFKGTYYNNKYHDPSNNEVPEYPWDEFALCIYQVETPNYQNSIYIDNLPKLVDKIDAIQAEKHTVINVSSVTELLNAINSIATSIGNNVANKYNQYDIHLASGSYELYPYLDLTKATNADTPFSRGLEIPDYVNLIGDGDVTISCTIPEADNSADHPYSYIISTLNIYANNKFENIKIVGNNTKYCIHDDYGGTIADCKVEFINCTMEHTGMASALYWTSPWCYGAGYDTNHIGIFKNCIFKHVEFGCLYVHTSGYGAMSSPCHIYVDNCAFDTPTGECIGFQVPWSTTDNVTGTLSVNNCFFADAKTIKLWGVLPSVVFGGGNTASLTITNDNSSTVYLNN